jgi:S1-C subfamily serine protease
MKKLIIILASLILVGCLPNNVSYKSLQKEISADGGHIRIYGNPSFSSANIKQAADFNCQRYSRIAVNFTQAHAGALFSGSEYSYWHYDCVNPTTIAATKPSNETSKEKPRRGASGTAFFINNNGNIVTNNHVVEGCSGPIKVLYNRKDYQAKLISKDGNLDLAVLSSDIKPNQHLKLSKKSGDKLDRVVAAGYPLGYKISDELKLTAGIVSATKGWKDNINEFQIDAALNPGNSGGPVVNDAGNLFGVAVAGLTDRQNLNFAIKSKAVKDFLDVNKVSYSTATIEFDMDNKKRLKLLEDSTVFIYCN